MLSPRTAAARKMFDRYVRLQHLSHSAYQRYMTRGGATQTGKAAYARFDIYDTEQAELEKKIRAILSAEAESV